MIDVADLGSLWELWILFVGVAAVGGVVFYRASAAFRLHPSLPLLLLASGIGVLSVGMPAAWTVAYVLTGDMFVCTVSSSVMTLGGVALLLTSVQWRAD